MPNRIFTKRERRSARMNLAWYSRMRHEMARAARKADSKVRAAFDLPQRTEAEWKHRKRVLERMDRELAERMTSARPSKAARKRARRSRLPHVIARRAALVAAHT